jgi:hypothetical protein
MPEARFEDIVKIYPQGLSNVAVDVSETFRFVVEEDTIEVISCVPSEPVTCGAYFDDGRIYVSFDDGAPTFVTLKISAIRKGRLDQRFTEHSEEDANKNIKFWDSWKNE